MKGKPRNRLSLIERAVLEAVMRCPRPQLRCLMRNVRKFYPRWGLDKEDITWGIKRLRASGILSGRFGKQGRSAILYRMANSRSAARRSFAVGAAWSRVCCSIQAATCSGCTAVTEATP